MFTSFRKVGDVYNEISYSHIVRYMYFCQNMEACEFNKDRSFHLRRFILIAFVAFLMKSNK